MKIKQKLSFIFSLDVPTLFWQELKAVWFISPADMSPLYTLQHWAVLFGCVL